MVLLLRVVRGRRAGVVSIVGPADDSVDPELLAIEVGAEELRPNPDDDESIQARPPPSIFSP